MNIGNDNIIRNCNKHGDTSFIAVKRHNEGKPYTAYVCRECKRVTNRLCKAKRRLKNKMMAIESKGGKCARCGFTDVCPQLFCFHHIDKNEKDLDPTVYLQNAAWERIKKELEKCELLCLLCHAREHSPNECCKRKQVS